MAMAAIPFSLEFSIENSIGWGRGESQIEHPRQAANERNIPFTFLYLRRRLLPVSIWVNLL
jgi:hypothetical protein